MNPTNNPNGAPAALAEADPAPLPRVHAVMTVQWPTPEAGAPSLATWSAVVDPVPGTTASSLHDEMRAKLCARTGLSEEDSVVVHWSLTPDDLRKL